MKIYLNGLNGIRAIAVLAVLVAHINNSFGGFKLKNLPKIDLAAYGVTIFFALSGFLITYLLLLEKQRGTVSIPNFYIRRILKIWPLYFFVILLALCLSPFKADQLIYYLLFIPNVPMVYGQGIALILHFWSLGIEEQFYLFWPWCIKYLRYTISFLLILIFLTVLLKLGISLRFGGWSKEYEFVYMLRYDCMAIGGIAAWLAIHKRQIVEHPYFRYAVITAWIFLGFVAFNKFHLISMIDHEIMALVTAIIILDQAFGNQLVFNLEKQALSYLGRISFGMYMYHPLVIFVLQETCGGLPLNDLLKYFLVYISITAATIFVSHISYVYFERPILSLKDKFSTIGSTN